MIASGARAGEAVDAEIPDRVVAARSDHGLSMPVFVGSGLTADPADRLLSVADGGITGTAVKKGNRTTNPVDVDRIQEVMAAVEAVRPYLPKPVSEFRLF